MGNGVDKAFNESMRRIMGPDWKPSTRARNYSNKNNTKGNMEREQLPGPKTHSWGKIAPRFGQRDWEKQHGDWSKLDEYGRPIHTKSGDRILRFR